MTATGASPCWPRAPTPTEEVNIFSTRREESPGHPLLCTSEQRHWQYRTGQKIMRVATLAAIAVLGIVPLAAAPQAKAEIKHYELNIPRQALDAALKDFAQQTGLQVGRFSTTINGNALVGPIKGNQTLAEALKTLLSSQGLTYEVVDDTTLAIIDPNDLPPTAGPTTHSPQSRRTIHTERLVWLIRRCKLGSQCV